MNGINLIPAWRIHARRRAARIRVWLSIVPAFATVMMGSYGWLRTTWRTDTASLQALIDDMEVRNISLEEGISRTRSEINRQQMLLRANLAVGEQPDWGVLLFILASHLGPDVALSTCSLEPAAGTAPAARPDQFRLTLTGLGKDQSAVSTFVLQLDRMPEPRIFERVRLLESRRVPLGGNDAVHFRIECTLVDGAPPQTAPARPGEVR